MPRPSKLKEIHLELNEPPDGLILDEVTPLPRGLAFVLKADPAVLEAGFVDNLIVEAFTERTRRRRGGKEAGQKQRISLGVLPALPIKLVQR
jgi:hypothetical protein